MRQITILSLLLVACVVATSCAAPFEAQVRGPGLVFFYTDG